MSILGPSRPVARAPLARLALVPCLALLLAPSPAAQADTSSDATAIAAPAGAPAGAPAPGNPAELVARVQAHYRAVIDELRAADVGHLGPGQRAARADLIAELSAYCERGDFGINRDFPGARVPYFVDADGRRCAVANLLDKTGEEPLVRRVAERWNHAYVVELADEPALAAWLDRVGLTLEEAVRIQVPMRGGSSSGGAFASLLAAATANPATGSGAFGSGASTSSTGTGRAGGTTAAAPDRDPRAGAETAGSKDRTRGGTAFTASAEEGWFLWWEMNKLRFLTPNRLRDAGSQTYAFRSRPDRLGAGPARDALLPLLSELLADDDALLRARAAVAFGRIGGADAVAPLLPLLSDDVQAVRHAAILGLGATGAMQAAPILLHLAEHGSLPEQPAVRVSSWARPLAVLAMGIGRRHGMSDVVDGFVADLAERTSAADGTASDDVAMAALLYQALSPSEDVAAWSATLIEDKGRGDAARCRAAELLAGEADPSTLPLLTRVLGGSELELRRSAALGLGGLAHPLVRAELQTAFELETEPVARGFLLVGLAEQGDEESTAFLAKVARKGNSSDRPWAALGLGLRARSGDEAAREAVRSGLDSERDRSVEGAWMLAAGLARDAESAAHLRAVVEDASNPRDRMFAALALGMIRDAEARPVLVAQLERETAPIAIVGLTQALGAFGEEGDAPALLRSVRQIETPQLQVLLSVAMGFHGTQGSLAGLLEIARDERGSASSRAAAVDALGLMLDPAAGLVMADVSSRANFYAFPGWVNEVLSTFTL